MNASGLYSLGPQLADLICHQRNKWGDDNTDAFAGKGRYLESDAFPTSCGHQPQGVTACGNAIDDFPLYASEILVAPIFFEKRK